MRFGRRKLKILFLDEFLNEVFKGMIDLALACEGRKEREREERQMGGKERN